MTFDKWFNKQSTLIKAILLLIPGVNWVVECLIRVSVWLRTKKIEHLTVLLLFVFVGWSWIVGVIDFVYMLMKGHLILGK